MLPAKNATNYGSSWKQGAQANLSKLLKPYTGENVQPLPSGFEHKLIKLLKPYLGEEGGYDKLLLRELGPHTGENGEPLPNEFAELIISAPRLACYLKFYLEGFEQHRELSVLLGPYIAENEQPLPTGFIQKIVELLPPRICEGTLLRERLELYTGKNAQPLPKELAEAIIGAPQDCTEVGLQRCLIKVTQDTLAKLLKPYTGENGQPLPSEFGYKLFKILHPYLLGLSNLYELISRALEHTTGENGQPLPEEVAKKFIEAPNPYSCYHTMVYLIGFEDAVIGSASSFHTPRT